MEQLMERKLSGQTEVFEENPPQSPAQISDDLTWDQIPGRRVGKLSAICG